MTDNSRTFYCKFCEVTRTRHYISMSHYSFCSDCANKVLNKALKKKEAN